MSRTMRVRKPVTIPYVAKITGVNGLLESDLPPWVATTEVTGVQVTSDIAPTAVADRTNVKNGDLVNFVIIERNVSSHVASHVGLFGGVVGRDFRCSIQTSAITVIFSTGRARSDLQSGAKLVELNGPRFVHGRSRIHVSPPTPSARASSP